MTSAAAHAALSNNNPKNQMRPIIYFLGQISETHGIKMMFEYFDNEVGDWYEDIRCSLRIYWRDKGSPEQSEHYNNGPNSG